MLNLFPVSLCRRPCRRSSLFLFRACWLEPCVFRGLISLSSSTWVASTCNIWRVSAVAEVGKIRRTSATAATRALRVWFSSMGANIRPIYRTSRMFWPRRTLPCVPLWCAATFRSTEACWRATALCKDCRLMIGSTGGHASPPLAIARAATAAADQATTRAAARPPLLTEGH